MLSGTTGRKPCSRRSLGSRIWTLERRLPSWKGWTTCSARMVRAMEASLASASASGRPVPLVMLLEQCVDELGSVGQLVVGRQRGVTAHEAGEDGDRPGRGQPLGPVVGGHVVDQGAVRDVLVEDVGSEGLTTQREMGGRAAGPADRPVEVAGRQAVHDLVSGGVHGGRDRVGVVQEPGVGRDHALLEAWGPVVVVVGAGIVREGGQRVVVVLGVDVELPPLALRQEVAQRPALPRPLRPVTVVTPRLEMQIGGRLRQGTGRGDRFSRAGGVGGSSGRGDRRLAVRAGFGDARGSRPGRKHRRGHRVRVARCGLGTDRLPGSLLAGRRRCRGGSGGRGALHGGARRRGGGGRAERVGERQQHVGAGEHGVRGAVRHRGGRRAGERAHSDRRTRPFTGQLRRCAYRASRTVRRDRRTEHDGPVGPGTVQERDRLGRSLPRRRHLRHHDRQRRRLGLVPPGSGGTCLHIGRGGGVACVAGTEGRSDGAHLRRGGGEVGGRVGGGTGCGSDDVLSGFGYALFPCRVDGIRSGRRLRSGCRPRGVVRHCL